MFMAHDPYLSFSGSLVQDMDESFNTTLKQQILLLTHALISGKAFLKCISYPRQMKVYKL